jgi:hypothetical protein
MKHLLLLVCLLVPAALSAGERPALRAAAEPPAVHLTGNRQVDFFGAPAPSLGLSTEKAALVRDPGEFDGSGDEKSPWIAGLLSLAVPGAGEVYTKNYVKGAIFFAAEATSWIVAYTYDKKGDDQTDTYKAFANEHWSAVRYTDWTLNHLGSLNPTITTSPDEYRGNIYDNYDVEPPCDPPFSCINWAALNAMEQDVAAGGGNGYTHQLPYYGEQQYYELIGKYEQFSRGWDDSDPASPLENSVPIRSTSANFFAYAKMRAKANDYYDVASTFVSVAVLNHVLSAADAFWSATRYNAALHADLRMRMQRTLYGYVPLTQATVRYTF